MRALRRSVVLRPPQDLYCSPQQFLISESSTLQQPLGRLLLEHLIQKLLDQCYQACLDFLYRGADEYTHAVIVAFVLEKFTVHKMLLTVSIWLHNNDGVVSLDLFV